VECQSNVSFYGMVNAAINVTSREEWKQAVVRVGELGQRRPCAVAGVTC
jgi:hypothetical protein